MTGILSLRPLVADLLLPIFSFGANISLRNRCYTAGALCRSMYCFRGGVLSTAFYGFPDGAAAMALKYLPSAPW